MTHFKRNTQSAQWRRYLKARVERLGNLYEGTAMIQAWRREAVDVIRHV